MQPHFTNRDDVFYPLLVSEQERLHTFALKLLQSPKFLFLFLPFIQSYWTSQVPVMVEESIEHLNSNIKRIEVQTFGKFCFVLWLLHCWKHMHSHFSIQHESNYGKNTSERIELLRKLWTNKRIRDQKRKEKREQSTQIKQNWGWNS